MKYFAVLVVRPGCPPMFDGVMELPDSRDAQNTSTLNEHTRYLPIDEATYKWIQAAMSLNLS